MGTVSETWDKADSATLGPNHTWTKLTTYAASVDLQVISNALSAVGTQQQPAAARCDVTMDQDNVRVRARVISIPASPGAAPTFGVFARSNNTTNQATHHYCFEIMVGTNQYYLWKRVANANTYYKSAAALPSGLTATAGAADSDVELVVEGSTIRAYWKGVLVDTWTDTALSGTTYRGVGPFFYIPAGNTTTRARYADFYGGPITLPVAPTKAADFVDDFEGTTVNTTLWDIPPSAITQSGGRLNIPQTSSYWGLFSKVPVDLEGSSVQVAVYPATNVAGSREDWLELLPANANSNQERLFIIHSGTAISARKIVGGATETTATLPGNFDPVAHLFRRWLHVPGQGFYAEVGPSASGPWTRLNSSPFVTAWNHREADIVLVAGHWSTETAGSVVTFDKLNVTMDSLALTGSMRPVGTTLRTLPRKMLAGSVQPSGTLARQKVAWRVFTATVAATGVLRRGFPKSFTGSTRPAGAFTKRGQKVLTASTRPAATMRRTPVRRLTGSITPVGVVQAIFLGRSFGRSGIVAVTVRAAGDLRLRLRRAF